MNKFKPGDKVYCPKYSTSVLRVASNKRGYDWEDYPLEITVGRDYNTLTNDGKIRSTDKQPVLFHATPENHKALEQLYGVEFEKPPINPSSLDIIQAMINRGDELVPCWVSDSIEDPDEHCYLDFIKTVMNGEFYNSLGGRWLYATPFDPVTGQAIKELPNIEFEKSFIKPSSSDIIQTMLSKGNKYIPCRVSDDIHFNMQLEAFIIAVSNIGFVDYFGGIWNYAKPFDPVTGKEITELPE